MTLSHKLRNAFTWAKIGLALAAPSAAEGWMNVQPGVHEDGYATIRLEGGKKLTERIGVYAFGEGSGTSEKSLKLREGLYGELRLYGKIWKDFSLAAQLDDGKGVESTVRFGGMYTPDFGVFTELRAFPVDSNDKGPQFTGVTQHNIGRQEKWWFSAFGDYNTKGPDTFYTEFEFGRHIGNWTPLLRLQASRGKDDPTPETPEETYSTNTAFLLIGKYDF